MRKAELLQQKAEIEKLNENVTELQRLLKERDIEIKQLKEEVWGGGGWG